MSKKTFDCLETHNLLDLIKERRKNIRKNFVTNPHAQHIESELNFIILCAEKVLNNGWISVDDDLPKEKSKCWVYGDNRFWVSGFELGRFNFDGHKITHWQEIVPPNEENDE